MQPSWKLTFRTFVTAPQVPSIPFAVTASCHPQPQSITRLRSVSAPLNFRKARNLPFLGVSYKWNQNNVWCPCLAFFTRGSDSRVICDGPAPLPFVMLNSPLLCGWATFHVPICQLMDIWIVSNGGYCQHGCCELLSTSVCMDIRFLFSWWGAYAWKWWVMWYVSA